MSPLANAAHVPFLKDSLVYVPDDTALGEFRSKFKNSLVLMEEKEPAGNVSGNDQGKIEKTINTEANGNTEASFGVLPVTSKTNTVIRVKPAAQ